MASVNTYLNFPGTCEQAFEFYKTVFGTEYSHPISRFSDGPKNPDHPLSPSLQQMIIHVTLPILGGYELMGSDAPKEFGFTIIEGNNNYINLNTDTRAETDRLFSALSVNGKIEQALQEMFWGAYYGLLTDQFGIHWMFNCISKD